MPLHESRNKVGIWIIGAYGDIASTLIAGSTAIRQKLASTTGLATEHAPFNALDLCTLDGIVFGGLDIKTTTVSDAVKGVYHRSRTISYETCAAIEADLRTINDDVVVDPRWNWNAGHAADASHTIEELVASCRDHVRAFRRKHALAHVVVVNLASAEPLPKPHSAHSALDDFELAARSNRKEVITPSMAYAYAALKEGCSHVNFTPNLGAGIPALEQLAVAERLPHCGNDGKTGETLIKTSLAPMFAQRFLHVMSWEGFNILGNEDGRTLNDPSNREAKLHNKGRVLDQILGYPLHAGVGINYVPSLGDWKTAWDFIHFRGFLDVPMSMQFTWQGCDSILAAPLVLDLARFTEFAARHGECGALKHLAGYFKNPLGVEEMSFYKQFDALLDYVGRHLDAASTTKLPRSAGQAN